MADLQIVVSDTTSNRTSSVYSLNVFVQPFIDAITAFQQSRDDLLSRDPEVLKNHTEAFLNAQKACAAAQALFAPIAEAVNEDTSRTMSFLARGVFPAERTIGLSELAVSQTREALSLALSSMLEIVPRDTPHYATIKKSLATIRGELPMREPFKAPQLNSDFAPI